MYTLWSKYNLLSAPCMAWISCHLSLYLNHDMTCMLHMDMTTDAIVIMSCHPELLDKIHILFDLFIYVFSLYRNIFFHFYFILCFLYSFICSLIIVWNLHFYSLKCKNYPSITNYGKASILLLSELIFLH